MSGSVKRSHNYARNVCDGSRIYVRQPFSNCTPNIIPNFTLFDSVTLGNGDSYNIATGIAGGQGAPASQFFGVSSATPFTTATFHEHEFSSFGVSDFRFNVVPEPGTLNLLGPALLIVFGGLKLGIRRKQ